MSYHKTNDKNVKGDTKIMDRSLDHALTTIDCTLDGMEAVVQMFMEVETVNAEAVGYLLINCISTVRDQCAVIEKHVYEESAV